MIINKTAHQIISPKERVCKSVFSQGWGLMFRRKQNLIMIFNKERKISLHNFFVFFPIDVLILNQNQEIVEIKREFRPFTLAQFQHPGKYVVELSFPGKYELGNNVEFIEKSQN